MSKKARILSILTLALFLVLSQSQAILAVNGSTVNMASIEPMQHPEPFEPGGVQESTCQIKVDFDFYNRNQGDLDYQVFVGTDGVGHDPSDSWFELAGITDGGMYSDGDVEGLAIERFATNEYEGKIRILLYGGHKLIPIWERGKEVANGEASIVKGEFTMVENDEDNRYEQWDDGHWASWNPLQDEVIQMEGPGTTSEFHTTVMNGIDSYYVYYSCDYCGNSDLEGDEVCDTGEDVGLACEVEYAGDDCQYCAEGCGEWIDVIAPYCGDANPDQNFEQCDDGLGGEPCEVEYDGEDCTYCSIDCEEVLVEAPYCGDGDIDLVPDLISVTPYEECEFDNDCDDQDPGTIDTCVDCWCDNYEPTAEICGYKFYDMDEDGEMDLQGDDYVLPDWRIKLKQIVDCPYENQWANEVISYAPGLQSDGSPIALARSDAEQALGLPQDDDTINFVSLGIGGELVLRMQSLIVNNEGNDLKIFETTFGDMDCEAYPDRADVYASRNGTDWVYLGDTCQDGEFDLGPLPRARFIKIIDQTNPEDFDTTIDGYDVDAVQALHCNMWELVDTAITDQEGLYCFSDLSAGYYRVAERMPPDQGWVNSTLNNPTNVEIVDSESVEVTFGNYQDLGPDCTDEDEDGYSIEGDDCGPIDCDDEDIDINPGTDEICDDVDNNCNDLVDEGWAELGLECSVGIGECENNGFMVCNPDNPLGPEICSVEAGEPGLEICDGLDNNCDTYIDEELEAALCPMQAGVCAGATEECGGELGWLTCDAASYGADYEESYEITCDDLDNDCDGATDEEDVCDNPCDAGWADCDLDPLDCETEIYEDIVNCGGCEIICSSVSGTPSCVEGDCQIECDQGYDDCDLDPDTGCESDLYIDTENCGGCGIVCEPGESCDAGVCTGDPIDYPECTPGSEEACGATEEGECEFGLKVCDLDGYWGECEGYIGPGGEFCDGLDNDCNGEVDEYWPLVDSACSAGLGICEEFGLYTCNPDNPAGIEICDAVAGEPGGEFCDGLDNDCNGEVDEYWPLLDTSCSTGVGVGICQETGTYTCNPDNPAGIEICAEITSGVAIEEQCSNDLDDDCDDEVDETDCYIPPVILEPECEPGETRACGESDVGICTFGTETCDIEGFWAECDAVFSAKEKCDKLDNDCDGKTDEGVCRNWATPYPASSTSGTQPPDGDVLGDEFEEGDDDQDGSSGDDGSTGQDEGTDGTDDDQQDGDDQETDDQGDTTPPTYLPLPLQLPFPPDTIAKLVLPEPLGQVLGEETEEPSGTTGDEEPEEKTDTEEKTKDEAVAPLVGDSDEPEAGAEQDDSNNTWWLILIIILAIILIILIILKSRRKGGTA